MLRVEQQRNTSMSKWNFVDTIHWQHRHIGRHISVCRYIGQALVTS